MRVKVHSKWDNHSFLPSRGTHFSKRIEQLPQFRSKYGPKKVLWVSYVSEGFKEVFMEEVTMGKEFPRCASFYQTELGDKKKQDA